MFSIFKNQTIDVSHKVEKIYHLAENEKVDLIFPSIVIGELIYTISKKKKLQDLS
jgi:hypothetical protein